MKLQAREPRPGGPVEDKPFRGSVGRVSGRLVPLGVAVALAVVLAGAIIVACYEIPKPDCGFLCGPGGACPEGYTCGDNQRCRRVGAPTPLVCPNPDAGLTEDLDAALDAPADAVPDGPQDSPVDAASDAADDAPTGASSDAPP